MVDPQLVRSFNSRQLSLVSGAGRVVVFAVLGGRHAGPSLQVHIPTAALLLERLPDHIDTVVFIDEPVPDAALVSLIDDMVAEHAGLGVDVVANFVPAVEAVKRIDGDRVREGIDRSRLVSVRPPEVLSRHAMQRAINSIEAGLWVNPAALVSAAGGSLTLYSGSHAAPPATTPRSVDPRSG